MKFLSRLTALLLSGIVILFVAGGAAGAWARGQAQASAPAPATTAQDPPGSASTVPLASAAATTTVPDPPPSGGGGAALPGLPGGGPAGVLDPVAAVAQDRSGTASAAPPAVAPGGVVTLTAAPPIIRRSTDTATITAVVTDAAGSPLAGVLVTFSLDDAEAGQLGTVQARTDAAGVATTTFAPEIFRGAATVSAATEGGASGRVTIAISCGC